MARQYELIPGCQAAYFPNETHTTIVINRLAAALEALVKQDSRHTNFHQTADRLQGESSNQVLQKNEQLQHDILQQVLQHGSRPPGLVVAAAAPHAAEGKSELLLHGSTGCQQTGLTGCYQNTSAW